MPLYTSSDDKRSNPSKIFTTQKSVPALASLCVQSLASLPLFDSPLALCKCRCEFPCQFAEGISRTSTVAPTRRPPSPPPQSTYVAPLCLSSPLAHHHPHVVAPSTPATMLLTVLPTDIQIEIAGHLAATLDSPMDDLHSLRATCSSRHCICGDPTIDRHLALN